LSYHPNDEPYRWLSVPRWYLWEGGFLLTARAQGVVPAHAHHAIQIVIALDGCVDISGSDGEWREARGIVVRPDAEHSFDCNGAFGVMVFVDPESSEGAWLSTSLRQDITVVPDTRLDSIVPELRAFAEKPDESADLAALVRRCIHGLRPGLAPTRRLDSRVTTVLQAIRASDELRMSLDQAADKACLSSTRFCPPVQGTSRSAVQPLHFVAQADASHGGYRVGANDRGCGTCGRFRGRSALDADVLSDGRHGPIRLDARRFP